ncbi:DUF4221 family protein [Algoriphagus zhangzhouensis]|uniref:DUF4221 domain-containing protein n=1 Tax=Algoriphagus zhangzhouensis TaxID=1073327 RepID=A0A1M7ZB32_9BACT|nr:DUF4221 family protein [Algoriphagus zhangzhouensis]TDY46926.1 uncharacterized protein DUF4221 [Algoriphagus zhangzhouensis]SHO62115.1 protein of unknown function [Algoriphagus zhangzhouensis]
MKKLTPLFSLLVFFACGEKDENSSGKSDFNFSYSIDTVQVDPGDHLVYITGYMTTATPSLDKKVLYNLNPKSPELEIIDLDALSFQESIPLEKEGPEGIGNYVSDLVVTDQGDFFFIGYESLVKSNPELDQYKRFSFQADKLSGDKLEENEGIDFGAIPSKDGNYFFGTYSVQMFQGKIGGLAVVDLNEMSLKKIPIPELENLVDFNINQYQDGRPMMSTIERIWLNEVDGKLYLTNSTRNEAFIYDPKLDSLFKKEFQSSITDNAKKGLYTKETNSDEEMSKAMKEKNKEVNFNELIYDDTNEKFWRVSSDMDRMIADSVVTKNILTIFDKDLNQIHEEKIDFNITSMLSFFKEGTLYSYINLEDEMGFTLIKPSYE